MAFLKAKQGIPQFDSNKIDLVILSLKSVGLPRRKKFQSSIPIFLSLLKIEDALRKE